MKIRKANLNDWEKYLILKKEEEINYFKIIKQESPKISKNEYKKEFLDLINKENNILFIAEEKKEFMGFINGRIEKYGDSKWTEMDVLFVSEKHRKKGIGKALTIKLERYAKLKKCKKIKLEVNKENKNAIKLYEKNGFRISKLKMEKRLK
jgi:ribosomal protein S18 acetylase RimI-like enzyme